MIESKKKLQTLKKKHKLKNQKKVEKLGSHLIFGF